MSHPYSDRPARSFWRTVVENPQPVPDAFYNKKFEINQDSKIAVAGSCFAQRIAKGLKLQGFHLLDMEPAPPGLPSERAGEYGYGIYSARYGNIYFVRQLLQLAQEAFHRFEPQCAIWEKDGRYYDAIRPGVEPAGLPSAEAVRIHRADHLRRVRFMLMKMDVMIFTMGMTECWTHKESGTVYPMAPGVIAGDYDPEQFVMKNFTTEEIARDFLAFRDLVKRRNPTVRFILTVSPVPIAATATEDHVLTATTYSKSALRAAAGQLASQCDDIDYFPSYEVVAGAASRGEFYEMKARSITPEGVKVVVEAFMNAHASAVTAAPPIEQIRPRPVGPRVVPKTEDVCEEALLEAFAP